MAQIKNMNEENFADLLNCYDKMKKNNPDVIMEAFKMPSTAAPENPNPEPQKEEHQLARIEKKLNRLLLHFNLVNQGDILIV